MQIVAITREAMPFGGDTVEYVVIPEGTVDWMPTLHKQYITQLATIKPSLSFGEWLIQHKHARAITPNQVKTFDADFGEWAK